MVHGFKLKRLIASALYIIQKTDLSLSLPKRTNDWSSSRAENTDRRSSDHWCSTALCRAKFGCLLACRGLSSLYGPTCWISATWMHLSSLWNNGIPNTQLPYAVICNTYKAPLNLQIEPGNGNALACLCCYLAGFWLCCCCTLCISGLMDNVHECKNCEKLTIVESKC